MAKPRKAPAPFPSQEDLLEFIREHPGKVGKREIARAFSLNADQKIELKKVLRQLEDAGHLQRGRGKRFAEPGTLPEVTVVEVTGVDADGEVLAAPVTWNDDDGPKPKILMAPERRGQPALGIGDRALARLERVGQGRYRGRTIRRLAQAPAHVLGVLREDGQGRQVIEPSDRRAKSAFAVHPSDTMGSVPGELVRAVILPSKRLGLRHARVVERIGDASSPKAPSLIAIHHHGLITEFPAAALEQAKKAGPAPLGKRADLRDRPLVTIDGADARDFDDAVFAEPDPDRDNPGGWHLIVAIADVAHYVRPGDALDRSAFERGNSVYFPDRVLPMLPEELSNGWCSLKPKEDRPCLAVHLWIDAAGRLKRHKFIRGLMRSAARLTYEQVQRARDGHPDDDTEMLADSVIAPLYGAFEALSRHRESRGVLDLDLPERRVVVGENGDVERIEARERLDSHKLIEEFMITANVAAAEALEKAGQPCMYRVHDQPSAEKLAALADVLEGLDLKLAKGQVPHPRQFNQLLKQVSGKPEADMVNMMILRSQCQAAYEPENIGHFGLALTRYSHFTSPIRRYADLLVHRALIRGYGLGEGGLKDGAPDYDEVGRHISSTERQAAAAERDAVDRFTAAYLSNRVGATFKARISGVTRFGLFITLEETGADGLVPISSLSDEYFHLDDAGHRLVGDRSGETYCLGDTCDVLLLETSPVTGGMVFRMLSDGRPGPKLKPRHAGKRHGSAAHKRGGPTRAGRGPRKRRR